MAADLRARDEAAIGSIGRLRFSPFAASRGQGSYLFDRDGRKIVDLSASAGAALLGYGHPAVVEAVQRAVRDAVNPFMMWQRMP
jgi:4-aminobutyrate aminotransferase